MSVLHWSSVLLVICCLSGLIIAQKQETKKSDPNDNKGLTPFFLQDPYDQTCLGPNGFTQCDENALWWLTKREGKKTYSLVSLLTPSAQLCLQPASKGLFGWFKTADRIQLGSCNSNNAKSWNWDFLDQQHVKLSINGMCLVKGKKGLLKNSVSLQPCKQGDYLPLSYQPTTIHEEGFYLRAPDGTCFNGTHFSSCVGAGASKLLWGMGIKYVKGEAKRYFFNFHVNERNKCIVAKGSSVTKDPCSLNGALSWGLLNGQLSFNNGAKCLGRKSNDEGILVNCKDGFEHVSLEVPIAYTNNDGDVLSGSEDLMELPSPKRSNRKESSSSNRSK